jgi:Fur family transcriptional regulator, ferric uptake regulator
MHQGHDQSSMEWKGKFRGCGYRITMARKVVLDILKKTNEHMSADDILAQTRSTHPNIGLTTIYRTLEVLTNLGFVYKFDFGDGRARYELAEKTRGANHHHHLICTGCNRVIDYKDFIEEEINLLRETEKGLSKKYNFMITNHLFQFYGLCESCTRERT